MFIIKHYELCVNHKKKNITYIRENKAFDIKIKYCRKVFVQKFVDYLGYVFQLNAD